MPSAFWIACYRNHTDCALALMDGADVNREENALSPLYVSVVHSNVILIKNLLKRGAADDSDAVYMALKLGHELVIHLLLDRGMWHPYIMAQMKVSPAVRAKLECIEHYKWLAALQRVDLIMAGVQGGASPPFRQWLKHLNSASCRQLCVWILSTLKSEALCFAAFFFKDCDAPIRRYTCTGSPVSELLVRYLVPGRARTRRDVRDMYAYMA